MSVLENNLVLVPVIEKQTGLVSLKNYEGLLEQVKKFAENNSVFVTFKDEKEMKICKQERTDLNKARDTIKKARLAIVRNLTDEFANQCKTIEKILDEASEAHTKSLNEYEETSKVNGIDKNEYTLVIKTKDSEAFKKVKAYAVKYGCEVIE